MLLAPIVSQLTPSKQTEGKKAPVETFKITDIPTVMDGLGWSQGARLMRKWFNNPAYEMPAAVKVGNVSPSTLSGQQLLTDLPFEWLFSSSRRIQDRVESLVSDLQEVREFNGLIGRTKSPLTQLSNGLVVFMNRLKRIGHLDENSCTLHNASEDFSGLSAIQLEETSQFNLIRIGATLWEKATDDLDDVYGALGSFVIKVAATKFRTYASDHGFPAIEIEEIGLYVRDTYDFLNIDGDQLLGYWNRPGVIRPGPIEAISSPEHIDRSGSRYFKVTNGAFNKYRQLKNKGGDFLVFSTVKLYPVSISVHLSKPDFKEFTNRKQGY
ncbi:DUF6402 family protein [Pseudomonas alcaligenes]|uniref:DUF6402 family protein n=1 Tax=Aquipseudomonas alcaligenes TaxID=43263 RepID=UPI00358F1E0D